MKSERRGFSLFSLFGPKKREQPPPEVEAEKQDMIRGIEELSETTVKEVMVPRIDVVFVDIESPLEELLERVADSGHSRLPAYEKTIDNVVGILYVKDILKLLVKNQPIEIGKLVRPAYFIPESKRLDDLLREMKRRRVHIAIVVDEYGGVSGIVCLEDIIEEIVGDIQDEFDNEEEEVVQLDERTFLCDARILLEELGDTLGIELESPETDTLGGFVFELLGKIPVRYERVIYNDIEFIVQDLEGHKIKKVKVVLPGRSGGKDARGEDG